MRPTPDEYFMDMAKLVASRSTCVRRSVGCVLVDKRKHVLATGYNGVAAGEEHCNHVGKLIVGRHDVVSFPFACRGYRAASGKDLDACEAIHAEQNALLQCGDAHAIDVAYVTAFPCMTCTKLLMNTSTRAIVFDQFYGDDAGRKMWLAAGRLAYVAGKEPHMIQADLVRLFGRDPLIEWRVAVACVCLNLASARVARGVVFRLLEMWPDPDALATSGDDLERLLKPLGLSDRRASNLRKISLARRAGVHYGLWPGVGPYAKQSIDVFVHGALPDDVVDRKVAAWVAWKRENPSEVGDRYDDEVKKV